MVESVQRSAWNHTAMICATMANIHRKPDSPEIHPHVFHPMERAEATSSGLDVDADLAGHIGRMFKKQNQGY
jgi:hypothetical protein